MYVGPILDNLLVTPLTLCCMSPREDCGERWEGCKSWKILWRAERFHSPYFIQSLQSLVKCIGSTQEQHYQKSLKRQGEWVSSSQSIPIFEQFIIHRYNVWRIHLLKFCFLFLDYQSLVDSSKNHTDIVGPC